MIEILHVPAPCMPELEAAVIERGLSYRYTDPVESWFWQFSGGFPVTPRVVRKVIDSCVLSDNPVVINGNGDFHHLTYGVCTKVQEPFGYIHIDAHTDFGDRYHRFIHMGGFVDRLLADTAAQKGLLIGCMYLPDCSVISLNELPRLFLRLEEELSDFPEQVYISVDLDVLRPQHFHSGYNCGRMTPNELSKTLGVILERKRVIGGDICGYLGNHAPSLAIAMDTILTIKSGVDAYISQKVSKDILL